VISLIRVCNEIRMQRVRCQAAARQALMRVEFIKSSDLVVLQAYVLFLVSPATELPSKNNDHLLVPSTAHYADAFIP